MTSEASTVLSGPPSPVQGSPFTSCTPVIQPRTCEYQILQSLMDRGHLIGQTWHPVHLPHLSLGLRSYRMGKKNLWGKELFSLWVPENVSDYFEDRGQHTPPSSRVEETLPFLTKPNERHTRHMSSPMFSQWSWNSRIVDFWTCIQNPALICSNSETSSFCVLIWKTKKY